MLNGMDRITRVPKDKLDDLENPKSGRITYLKFCGWTRSGYRKYEEVPTD